MRESSLGQVNLFDLEYSSGLASIVGDLMSDGHLQGEPKWRLDYCSNSFKELIRFENVFYSVFGVKGKVRNCTANKYGTMNYGVNNRQIAKMLNRIGVPAGAKVHSSYLIPNWICESKPFFCSFAKRYFDCEGCVDKEGRMSIVMWKKLELVSNGISFMNQFKELLKKYFEIKTTNPFLGVIKDTKRGQARAVKLKISNRSSLLHYFQNIGFDNEVKMQKLKNILKKSIK